MSLEKEKKKNTIKENISKKISITDKNLPSVKKHHKKSFRKSRFNNQIKVIPLLKPPNQRRKSEKLEIPNNKSGIIWYIVKIVAIILLIILFFNKKLLSYIHIS